MPDGHIPETTQRVADSIRTPRGKGEASRLMSRIGSRLRASERIHTTRARQIARLEEQIRLLRRDEARRCEPLENEACAMAEKLAAYVEPNRAKLTQNGKLKRVLFRTGDQFRWQRCDLNEEHMFFKEVERPVIEPARTRYRIEGVPDEAGTTQWMVTSTTHS